MVAWRSGRSSARAVYDALPLLHKAEAVVLVSFINHKSELNQAQITMAKLFAGDLAQKVVYDCMQFYGGFGYTTEYPIGRAWRDTRLITIGGGTSEVMKEILIKLEGL